MRINVVNSKFNIVPIFVFHCKKAEKDLSKSYFFLFLRNKAKLMINSEISHFFVGNTNSHLGATFKILYFVVKNEQPFGRSFQDFVFRSKKTKWSFGYSFKILHFSVKEERMAV